MQTSRALVCGAPGEPLRQTQLEQPFVLTLATSGPLHGVEVYVLPKDALASLASALPAGAIIDRGAKHHSKALSDYFARREGLLMVRATYTQPGQAERGIRALVAATAPLGASGRYFVGVPQAIFEALWERASEHTPARAHPAARHPAAVLPGHLQELLEVHPSLEIPEFVRRSFIGNASAVRLVHHLIVLAARCTFPVLIVGETGTGKEIVARCIHALQFGVAGKCVAVNCGGIPTELFESELFGHVKGSFTSATRDKLGLWQDAQNGTLFLDEVGDLSASHQVKVLRALEDRTFTPVGGLKPFKSNARVLSATHRNLPGMVRAGKFREDLYHRLVTLRIRTPALREHPEDIPAIARHLWRDIRVHARQALPDEVVEVLQGHPLPGNVRELRSILAGLAMLSDGKPLSARLTRLVLRERGGDQDL